VRDLEAAVDAHARQVLAGDAAARADLVSDVLVEPSDLYDRLLQGSFRGFEVVGHARLGAYHIFKTKYVGPITLVIQERWVQGGDGVWRVHEVELARVAVEAPG
jgi:hypothetical protein